MRLHIENNEGHGGCTRMTKEVMVAFMEKIMVMETAKEDNVNGGCTRTIVFMEAPHGPYRSQEVCT